MATVLDDKERDVIPRWRDFNTTVAIGELKSSRQATSPLNHPKGDFLAPKLKDWSNNRTIAYAAEVVGTAYLLGRYREAIEAANFLIKQKEGVSESLKSIAKKIVNPNTISDEINLENGNTQTVEPKYLQQRIHHLRNLLKQEPRNSILYVDMARGYTLLDENEKAVQAMGLALKISPNNRFILRSAARLFLHTKDYNQAHKILRQAEITKYDSWLLAAEIAVASAVKGSSRFAKTGQRLLADNKLSPLEITELATALAMLEIDYGKSREARKLIQKAIESPTENSLAQIEWAARNKIKLNFVQLDNFEAVPLVHEAKAWEYFFNGEWRRALAESWRWFYDQPFSDRPLSLGSHIASTILGDYEESVRILEKGRVSNPNDIMVLNNLAFSYASLDDVDNAKKVFDEINTIGLSHRDKIVITATEGLIAFRFGNIEKGRAKYFEAIRIAEENNLPTLQARAYIYFAREEMKAKTSKAENARKLALEKLEESKTDELEIIAKRELRKKNESDR